jgi:hypothetical protein
MATTVETLHGHRLAALPLKLSWGAIFGGTFFALATWFLLFVLGAAIGVTSANLGHLRGAGVFTGVWALVTPLVALFLGGMVAARMAGVIDRAGAAVVGLVVWAFATLASVGLLTSLFGVLFGNPAAAAVETPAERNMTLWGMFISLALALVSAVLGAVTGVTQRQVIAATAVPYVEERRNVETVRPIETT